jgi:hypothetical protein
LARISAPGWVRHGAEIESALAEILPILSHARDARLTDMEDRRARMARGRARLTAQEVSPRLTPHHAHKRRKGSSAGPAEVAAQAAMAAMDVQPRRLGPGETVESVIAREAGNVRAVAGSGLTRLGHAAHPAAPQHPAKPKTGMRETTKR